MKKFIIIISIVLVNLLLMGSCSTKNNSDGAMLPLDDNLDKSFELNISNDQKTTTITDKNEIVRITESRSSNINLEKYSFIFTIIASLATSIGVIIAIFSLKTLTKDNYEKTRGKFSLINKQIKNDIYIAIKNVGLTEVKITKIEWTENPILINDIYKSSVDLNVKLFEKSINQYIQPSQSILYILFESSNINDVAMKFRDKCYENKLHHILKIEYLDFKNKSHIQEFDFMLAREGMVRGNTTKLGGQYSEIVGALKTLDFSINELQI